MCVTHHHEITCAGMLPGKAPPHLLPTVGAFAFLWLASGRCGGISCSRTATLRFACELMVSDPSNPLRAQKPTLLASGGVAFVLSQLGCAIRRCISLLAAVCCARRNRGQYEDATTHQWRSSGMHTATESTRRPAQSCSKLVPVYVVHDRAKRCTLQRRLYTANSEARDAERIGRARGKARRTSAGGWGAMDGSMPMYTWRCMRVRLHACELAKALNR